MHSSEEWFPDAIYTTRLTDERRLCVCLACTWKPLNRNVKHFSGRYLSRGRFVLHTLYRYAVLEKTIALCSRGRSVYDILLGDIKLARASRDNPNGFERHVPKGRTLNNVGLLRRKYNGTRTFWTQCLVIVFNYKLVAHNCPIPVAKVRMRLGYAL